MPGSQDQTVRTTIAHAARLAKDPELMARFIRGYADTIDWMVFVRPESAGDLRGLLQDPAAIYAEGENRFLLEGHARSVSHLGLDAAMAEAVAGKFLPAPLTKEQLADLFRVPQRSK